MPTNKQLVAVSPKLERNTQRDRKRAGTPHIGTRSGANEKLMSLVEKLLMAHPKPYSNFTRTIELDDLEYR